MASKEASTETSREESLFKKNLLRNKKRSLTGRQVAWMKNEYVMVNDTDAFFLDSNEFFNAELKNDNVQSFNTRWDETIVAIKSQNS